LERARHAAEFDQLGLKTTPAIVVLDGSEPGKLTAAAKIEGAITTKTLLPLFEKAQSGKK
jgi:hypothetical protein